VLTLEELRANLERIVVEQSAQRYCSTQEEDHVNADYLLLEYIADASLTELYGRIEKWYA